MKIFFGLLLFLLSPLIALTVLLVFSVNAVRDIVVSFFEIFHFGRKRSKVKEGAGEGESSLASIFKMYVQSKKAA